MLVIVVLSIAVGVLVRKKLKIGRERLNVKRRPSKATQDSKNKEKQVLIQLILIVTSFLIGYLPSAGKLVQ